MGIQHGKNPQSSSAKNYSPKEPPNPLEYQGSRPSPSRTMAARSICPPYTLSGPAPIPGPGWDRSAGRSKDPKHAPVPRQPPPPPGGPKKLPHLPWLAPQHRVIAKWLAWPTALKAQQDPAPRRAPCPNPPCTALLRQILTKPYRAAASNPHQARAKAQLVSPPMAA